MDSVYNKYCKVFFVLDRLDLKYKEDLPSIPTIKKPPKPEKSIEQKEKEMKDYKRQYYLENKERYAERNRQYRLEKKNKE